MVTKAKEVGINFRRVPKTNSVLEDIEVCRRGLKQCYIHSRCENLIEHLDAYREGSAGKPVHDSHSHGADAFRTMMMAIHLSLVEPYLSTGSTIKLPKFVSPVAHNYAEGELDVSTDEGLFWG